MNYIYIDDLDHDDLDNDLDTDVKHLYNNIS